MSQTQTMQYKQQSPTAEMKPTVVTILFCNATYEISLYTTDITQTKFIKIT